MCFSWRQRHHKSDQPVTAIVKGRYRNQTTPTGVFVLSIDARASTPVIFGLEYKVKLQKVKPVCSSALKQCRAILLRAVTEHQSRY